MSKQVQEGSVLVMVMVEYLVLDQPSHTKKQKHTLYKNNDLKELERNQKQAETRGGIDTLKKLRALFFYVYVFLSNFVASAEWRAKSAPPWRVAETW